MAPDIALRHADARTRLATYLNDHLGGSATGRELARRTLQANRGNEYGVVLEGIDLTHLAGRAREQRQTVERLRRQAAREALI